MSEIRHRPKAQDSGSKMENKVVINSMVNSKWKRCWIISSGLLSFLCVAVVVLISQRLYSQYNSMSTVDKETEDYFEALVNSINGNRDLKWTARRNPFATRPKKFDYVNEINKTAVEDHIRQLENFFESETMKSHTRKLVEYSSQLLPKDFDARRHWPQCSSISRVPNQGSCGSCFAMAAVGVASDRACIASNGSLQMFFSGYDVLGCCKSCGSCFGGDPLKVLLYWVQHGLVTGGRDGCRPYSFNLECGIPCSIATYPESEKQRRCKNECQSNYFHKKYADDKHYASVAYTMYPRTMRTGTENRADLPSVIGTINKTYDEPLTIQKIREIIMKELYLFGPVTFAFPTTEEFVLYSKGIFSPYPTENIDERIVYWHVVRLIGWNHDEQGNHHWLAINSFGKYWGDYGTFRIDSTLLERFGLEYEAALS